MNDAQFAELADVIGFDPRTITKEQLPESGAGLATEVALDFLITALTLGAGATIVVASKLRHLNKFKQIGLHIKQLA